MTKFNARLLTLTTIFCCSLSLGACVAEQGETNLETIESASRSDQRGDRPDEIDADRPTCADQCKARARTAVGQCVDSGRDRETCIRYGRNLVANCVENHCEQDDPY